MIKRVNSTGRRRIPRDRIAIEVVDGDPRTFDATIDLSEFDAPPAAEVVIEAKCAGSNVIPRFPWGTVGNLAAPQQRELRGLTGRNILFSLKVIDRTERFGRILGIAEEIRPLKGGDKTATGRQGILPVEPSDLGDELWRLEFKNEDVYLLVNSQVPDLKDRFRYDPTVFSLIYPTIIREILRRALTEVEEAGVEEDRWPTLWLRFAKNLCPNQEVPNDSGADAEIKEEWIEDVVAAFCHKQKLKTKFCERPVADGS